MNVYIYSAALYCEDCGEKIRTELKGVGQAPDDIDDETSYDSDDFPKGPFPDGGGEADTPQHCDECGVFLENPLTTYGGGYVVDAVNEARAKGRKESVAVTEWAPFYDYLEFTECEDT